MYFFVLFSLQELLKTSSLVSLTSQLHSILTIISYKSRINTVRTAIFNLYIDVITFREHFNSLAIAQLTPSLIVPTDLFKLMQQVERDISSRPKLKLPLALNSTNTFKYYQILSVHTIQANITHHHRIHPSADVWRASPLLANTRTKCRALPQNRS